MYERKKNRHRRIHKYNNYEMTTLYNDKKKSTLFLHITLHYTIRETPHSEIFTVAIRLGTLEYEPDERRVLRT